jgi:hypothetical protein
VIDLDATLKPGKSAAGLKLGTRAALAADAVSPRKRKQLAAEAELVDFGPVLVWTKHGMIIQVGVRDGYRGSVANTAIRIGSTLHDVINAIGQVLEDDEDNLIVPSLPGLCFETETWRGDPGNQTVAQNLDARITEFFVYQTGASAPSAAPESDLRPFSNGTSTLPTR